MPKDPAGQRPLLSLTGRDFMLSLSSLALPDEGGHFFGNRTALLRLVTGHPWGRGPWEAGVWSPEVTFWEGSDYRLKNSKHSGR